MKNEYVEELAKIYEDAKTKLKEFELVQQDSDKKINDIQHCIEFGNCDAVMYSKLFKKMREALQERREAKDSIPLLHSIVDRLKFTEKADKDKNYVLRTDILEDIVGKKKGQKLLSK